MGAANDYHTFNLQLAKERSWVISHYNVQQPVLRAVRNIILHWEDNSQLMFLHPLYIPKKHQLL